MVCARLDSAWLGLNRLGKAWLLPLSEPVGFKVVLQRGNRVQVPRLVRWQVGSLAV